jgi:filamentous hemagglutinin
VNVTLNATLSSGCVDVCIADQVVTAQGQSTLKIPAGFTATDLNGNLLTSIPLNAKGQAIIEIKTGSGQLTEGQANVYPQAQTGNATGVGNNAIKTGMGGSVAPTPVVILRKN